MSTNYDCSEIFKAWKENHARKGYPHFIEDGIFSEELWSQSKLKVCFLLKEAYGEFESLTQHIEKWGEAKYQIWNNCSYWLYGLKSVYEDNPIPNFKLCKDSSEHNYCKGSKDECYDLLRHSAIVNLKKSNGVERSNDDNLLEYVENDGEYIKKQIETLNPNIIICGGTFEKFYQKLYNVTDENQITDWTYFHDNRLVFDFVHPAYQAHGAMMYYMISSLFIKALKEEKVKAIFGGP